MKFSQDKLKNSQLHRNRDFRDHFLRFRDIRDQVFKKGTLGDLRDQVFYVTGHYCIFYVIGHIVVLFYLYVSISVCVGLCITTCICPAFYAAILVIKM